MEATKKIYIVRHGQTDYNKRGVVQGSGIDAPLNNFGRAQGQAFYEAYKNEGFQKVYTSVLQRTQQSVAGFIEGGLPTEALEDLNEIGWGEKEGVPFDPELDRSYERMLEAWRAGNLDVKIPGGESPNEVAVRVKRAIDYIVSQPEDKVLICAHGRTIRILMSVILNYPLSNMDQFRHANLCLYRLAYTGSLYSVEDFCNVDHLVHLEEPVQVL